jgi:deferrochelatase/peroxidase EfeB
MASSQHLPGMGMQVLPVDDNALQTVIEGPSARDFHADRLTYLLPTLAEDLQSGILLGHCRLKSRYVFLRFGKRPAAARRLVRDLTNGIPIPEESDAIRVGCLADQIQRGSQSLATNLLLTAAGYRALGFDPSALFGENSFVSGCRDAETIARLLDPPVVDWEHAYQEPWHALVLLSHDDPRILAAGVQALLDHLRREGGADVEAHLEFGNLLDQQGRPSADSNDNFEIFGFRDGISQPVFLQEHWSDVRRTQYGNVEQPSAAADPRSPLSLTLIRDPLGRRFCNVDDARHCFGFGSFFVFRKLQQDYRGFAVRQAMYEAELNQRREYLEALYATKDSFQNSKVNPYSSGRTNNAPAFVLSSLVGRHPSGAPIMEPPASSTDPDQYNNFDFASDPQGATCPFAAHIRKANPRGTTGDLADERSRRIVRRGMPYGSRADRRHEVRPQAGLLFLCAQANIRDQFEFIQGIWLNGKVRPDRIPTPGIDRLVGQARPVEVRPLKEGFYGSPFGRRESRELALEPLGQNDRAVRRGWLNQTVLMNFDFQEYVELRGAEYLYAPSLSGLSTIASKVD